MPHCCVDHLSVPHCNAGVVSWKQCLSDNQAWDTLTWFAALIAMAAYLNKYGFISWFSDKVRACCFVHRLIAVRLFLIGIGWR